MFYRLTEHEGGSVSVSYHPNDRKNPPAATVTQFSSLSKAHGFMATRQAARVTD